MEPGTELCVSVSEVGHSEPGSELPETGAGVGTVREGRRAITHAHNIKYYLFVENIGYFLKICEEVSSVPLASYHRKKKFCNGNWRFLSRCLKFKVPFK